MNKYTKTNIHRLCKSYIPYIVAGAVFTMFAIIMQETPSKDLEGHFLQQLRLLGQQETVQKPTHKDLRRFVNRQQRRSVMSLRPEALSKRVRSSSSSSATSTLYLPLKAASSVSRLTIRTSSSVPAAMSQKASVSSAPLRAAAPVMPSSVSASSISAIAVIVYSTTSSQTILAKTQSADVFPAFGRAMYPVGTVPNWGAMRTPAEWNRTYKEMKAEDFVRLPSYDMAVLTTPMSDLTKPLREENFPAITSKLTYSTRFFSAYNLDAGEFTGKHAGIDFKLAPGTPIGAVAGGRVQAVLKSSALGTHVIVEHHTPDSLVVFSIYGHLESAWVAVGDSVEAGEGIGAAGNTGNSTSPHLHLQIDKAQLGETGIHTVYMPSEKPSPSEASRYVWNPITWIGTYAKAGTATVTR